MAAGGARAVAPGGDIKIMITMNERSMKNARDGQAIVELVVSLIVILILVAGTIQISWLGVRHSKLMNEARQEAGQKAMSDASSFAGPKFISDCTVGQDDIAFSRDDDANNGDVGDFTIGVVNYAHPSDLDRVKRDNPVSAVAKSAFPQYMFGLVQGEKKDTVDLIPVVRELIYRKDSVELKGSAWMTWTKGLY